MIRKIMLGLTVLCLSFSINAFAEPEFSADMNMTSGGQNISGKVYYKKDRMRYEMPQAITITRLDLRKSYVLMPAQNMYMEQTLDSAAIARTAAVGEGELSREPLGQEPVNGRNCHKFRVTYKDTRGTMVVIQWIDDKNIPVKLEAEDGTWSVEYDNISEASQPDSLFEIPAGYQSMQMPNMQDVLKNIGQDENADRLAGESGETPGMKKLLAQIQEQQNEMADPDSQNN